jgi:rod shape determining protein RodA
VTTLARRVPTFSALPWRRLRTFDWPLLAASIAATILGLLMIYSATQRNPAASAWEDLVVKQAAFAILGLVALALLAATDYRVLLAFGFWIYVATVGALAAVLLLGKVSLGSVRWFSAGFADLQPSEFAKVAVVVFLAAYFERFDIERWRYVIGSLLLVGFAALLILSQPNLSTAVLLGVVWLGVAFAAGIKPLHAAIITLASIPMGVAVLQSHFIEDYMVTRVAAWLDPLRDPLGYGFQNIQTLIAVASGGALGSGYASGPLAKGGWLVVLHTDNIFALIAEELGFVGAAAVIVLLTFIVLRIFRAAGQAQDRAGTLICVGVGTYILAQAAVNVGVVLQLLPVTGVSLPFVSYGGSSLLALFVGIGLVESVLVRRRPLEFAP